jgi:hypothetical protein
MILNTSLTIILQIHLLQQRNVKKTRTQMKHERCHITKIRAENVYHKTMLQNKNKSTSSMFEIL